MILKFHTSVTKGLKLKITEFGNFLPPNPTSPPHPTPLPPNRTQCNLHREASKISALSSGESEKYEYLTGGYVGYKPRVVERAKFEYSPFLRF